MGPTIAVKLHATFSWLKVPCTCTPIGDPAAHASARLSLSAAVPAGDEPAEGTMHLQALLR